MLTRFFSFTKKFESKAIAEGEKTLQSFCIAKSVNLEVDAVVRSAIFRDSSNCMAKQ